LVGFPAVGAFQGVGLIVLRDQPLVAVPIPGGLVVDCFVDSPSQGIVVIGGGRRAVGFYFRQAFRRIVRVAARVRDTGEILFIFEGP